MKGLRLALLTVSIFALFYSCQKEKSFETGGGGAVKTDWEFKENNKLFKGRVDTAYVEDFGSSVKSLFLEGTTTDGSNQTLSIQVIGFNTTAGATYQTPSVLFEYTGISAPIYTSDITATGDFTVVVTKVDSASVTGTFTGKVKDSANAIKNIVEGKFSAKLHNSNTPPPPPQNGQLTFWAKASCTAGGNITVKLSNNQTGTITSFNPAAPTCGTAGTASFTVPEGNYTWKAYCGTQDSTSGSIAVVANQCVTQEVNFSTVVTNCHVSDYTFYESTTNLPVYTIHSIYNASNVVTNVQLIDSANLSIDNDFHITYSTGKVQIDQDQYFVLDGSGKVTEFHGYSDPGDNTSTKLIVRYSYDGSGYLSQYTFEDADTPGVIIWKGVLTWTGGNFTKLVETDPTAPPTAVRYETTYDYYTSSVKNFIYDFPLPEISYFQSAINAGKNSANAIKTETYKAVDPTTGIGTTISVSNYDQYTIDSGPNPYVRNFRASSTGDPTIYKIVLQYHCF